MFGILVRTALLVTVVWIDDHSLLAGVVVERRIDGRGWADVIRESDRKERGDAAADGKIYAVEV